MLRFFRHIRKNLMEQNKTRTYLLYALGEISLVMIGILLALQVNNWNEERKDLQREQVYLNRLHQNLSTDLETYQLNIEFYQQVLESGTQVLQYANEGQSSGLSYWDLLVAVFHASQIWPVITEESTYEELKSAGELSLLRNVTLRDRLGFYYGGGQVRYTSTIGINPSYRKMSRMLLPYSIQGMMWDECHETIGDVQRLLSCTSPISETKAKALLDDIVADTELMGELSFFMSSIRAGWRPLQEQRNLCEELLQEINRSQKGV